MFLSDLTSFVWRRPVGAHPREKSKIDYEKRLRKMITLEFQHIESNSSSCARTVQLAITPFLTYANAILMSPKFKRPLQQNGKPCRS